MTESYAGWWAELTSAALIGSARRPVPPLPDLGVVPRPDARGETTLLDAAALGGTLLRAGRRPAHDRPAPEPVADETAPAAPERAVRLLELLLTQAPVSAHQRDQLLLHWFRAATGHRLPHQLLPTVLDRATVDRSLQEAVRPVLGHRGRWLAGLNPAWAWATDRAADDQPPTDPHAWARSRDRATLLAQVRTTDPAAGRALLLSTWSTDAAKDRQAHLEALRIGLAAEDEEVLEMALDDRAASVRATALDLLDGLPGSARAARMAERLRPLLATTGRLRPTLEVALPEEVDAAGARDGLGKPPPRRSQRGWWLERVAAGAPLEVWTETGVPLERVVAALPDDAWLGVRRAVLARRDPVWARAMLRRQWDAALVPCLPRADREELTTERLRGVQGNDLAGLLGAVPGPWGAGFSAAALAALRAQKSPALPLAHAAPMLAAHLHADAVPLLEGWLATGPQVPLATLLRSLVQYHSVKRSISEAFS